MEKDLNFENINKEELPYREAALAFVINDHNEILLVQKHNYSQNQWEFPGGGIEEDEDPQTAAIRELEEELSTDQFEIKQKSPVQLKYDWDINTIKNAYDKTDKLYRGQLSHQLLIKYKGNKNLEIDPEEIRTYKWVSIIDLDKYLIFEGQLENAKRVLESFNLI